MDIILSIVVLLLIGAWAIATFIIANEKSPDKFWLFRREKRERKTRQ